jgi:hypothetical protein
MCDTFEILYDFVSQFVGGVVAFCAIYLSHSAVFEGKFGDIVCKMM